MKLVVGLEAASRENPGCVATIGNFDGVHRGHRAVIDRLVAESRRLSLPVCVVLFEPQPREYFAPNQAPPRLMRLRDKIDRLSELPVDRVLVLKFNRSLAALSPEAFIEKILVETLGVRYLVIGDDFRFGQARAGDFRLLVDAGARFGFEVQDTPSILADGQRISSTLIREALLRGELDLAGDLLGKPYEVCGRIIHGEKIGRTLGFPTANLPLRRRSTPVRGVFAVTMRGLGPRPWPGVANVGYRPTVQGDPALLLETHLLDFQGNLYGRRVEVEFHAKIRDEQRFNQLDDLRHQIARDILAARDFFEGPFKIPRETLSPSC
jgi:riboflavin kinase/FMN adenylyltransferase